MTRINCVPVEELSNKHLLAEYRELPRVFRLLISYQHIIDHGHEVEPLPEFYTMGKGHVRFFYDKASWLVRRQEQLIAECKARGYKVIYDRPQLLLRGVWARHRNDWEPTPEAIAISRARIEERLNGRK